MSEVWTGYPKLGHTTIYTYTHQSCIFLHTILTKIFHTLAHGCNDLVLAWGSRRGQGTGRTASTGGSPSHWGRGGDSTFSPHIKYWTILVYPSCMCWLGKRPVWSRIASSSQRNVNVFFLWLNDFFKEGRNTHKMKIDLPVFHEASYLGALGWGGSSSVKWSQC